MTIGKTIRALRQEQGMTQSALAERLGVSNQTVSKWEQGITAPDLSLLGPIAAVFFISTDELLGVRRFSREMGYKNQRERLLAVYEAGGTEEDFGRAAAAYEDVILRRDPETTDYMMYGYLYHCRAGRDIHTALRYYEKALEAGEVNRDWTWFKTHQQISLLCNMMGRGDEAVERWKQWLEREPDNVQAYLSVIWALYHARRASEALPYLEKAIQRFPEDPSVLCAMGDVLGGEHGLGRYQEAIEWWDRAFTLDDQFGDVFWSTAYACEQMGDYDRAENTYNRLIEWLRDRGYDAGVEEKEIMEKLQHLKELQTTE